MKKPPHKEKPAPPYSGSGMNRTSAEDWTPQDRTDIRPSKSWTVPIGGDGFTVEANTGKVIISQSPICAEKQTIILNAEEALRLNVILLSAIETATGKV